jgi:hypothetical protein
MEMECYLPLVEASCSSSTYIFVFLLQQIIL